MKNLKALLILLVLFSFENTVSIAQERQNQQIGFGVGMGRYFSGNGMLSKFNPALEIQYGNKALSIGPLLRIEGFSGITAMLKHELVREACNLRPYLFVSTAYHQGGSLKASLANILSTPPDNALASTVDKYEVMEAFAGMGFTWNIIDSWYLDGSIGAGRYSTLNVSELRNRTEDFLVGRPDHEFVLMYKLGMLYEF